MCACRRLVVYPHHLQGNNGNIELIYMIATAVVLQAFTAPNSYPQVRPEGFRF